MKSKEKSKIVLYNKTWGMELGKEYTIPINDDFEMTTMHEYIDQAVAIIFHMPTLSDNDIMLDKRKKKKKQLWVFWSMECELHYKWQYESKIMSLFDIMATYKFDSDVPVPYLYSGYSNAFTKTTSLKTELINAFISSDFDLSNRKKYLKELMSHIKVNSYGKVFNNKLLNKDNGELSKLDIISKYKFSVAFENAIAKDYVTEKFFQPLLAGSVPIYLGAPNIGDFAPGDNSYINIESFSSAKDLSNYLMELNEDDSKYQEYHKWRNFPIKDNFNAKLAVVSDDPLSRLCKVITKKLVQKKLKI